MRSVLAACAAGGLLAIALAVTVSNARASQDRVPREDPNSGSYLYRTYCVSCHGTDGRGGGPAARTLLAAPPDLTTIAERRGGIYPSIEIAQIIDGRKRLAGHTRLDMPVWGTVLGTMELHGEPAIKARVDALVTYLESLQRNRWR